MMYKDKKFDDKLLDQSFTSLKDAYRTLPLPRTRKSNGNVLRQFRKVRTAFQTDVVCVTDKDVQSIADCQCSYRAVIKKKRTKDDNKYNIEKEGKNLEHIGECLRNSATCPGNTTVRSEFMQHVQALHPISLSTIGKQVAKTLAEKEKMNVQSKQAKVVLNMRNGITKKEYRKSYNELDYFQKFFNEEGNAKMELR